MAVNQTGSTAQQSLSTGAARQLATTTKTVPQMVGITPRWFLRLLPWIQVEAGKYRVNRCKVIMREQGQAGDSGRGRSIWRDSFAGTDPLDIQRAGLNAV